MDEFRSRFKIRVDGLGEPEFELEYGSFGADLSANNDLLRQAQAKINVLGYTPALVTDGIWGPKTAAGIQWARTKFSLMGSGLDESLIQALGLSIPPPSPSSGKPSAVPGIQASVVENLPQLFGKWEGAALPYMYADSKGYVTTGTGNK